MRRNEINGALRAYARNLSPTEEERNLVTSVYAALGDCLGVSNCLQIGSYPRFTSITPLHDLDVLYVLGQWLGDENPADALDHLQLLLRDFVNPTHYQLAISRQTHSITISFTVRGEEVFAVDVVPAYAWERNEFGDHSYVVPEIATKTHRERRQISEAVQAGTRGMAWIASDPRGYIRVASDTNDSNGDFRKAAKLIKKWRSAWKDKDENFPLKSFHLEQLVTRLFQDDPNIDIFGALFEFFVDLPNAIRAPQIPDRADAERMIDAYVAELTSAQIAQITQARDFVLKSLEEITDPAQLPNLFSAKIYKRPASEQFLFDQHIPTLTESAISIQATALARDGFRATLLDALGIIAVNRKIEFRAQQPLPAHDLLMWKVRNDDASEEPRGEITRHSTKNDPENTRFRGNHYTECYVIRQGVCVAKARQNVVLGVPQP